MFDDTARLLAISWVLFEGDSKTTAAKRLLCDRSTVEAWNKAYKGTGEWWPDPAIRNRHADNVLFDEHFVQAVSAVALSDPEQLLGEMKDVFLFSSTFPGYRDAYKCSIATLDRVLRAVSYGAAPRTPDTRKRKLTLGWTCWPRPYCRVDPQSWKLVRSASPRQHPPSACELLDAQ